MAIRYFLKYFDAVGVEHRLDIYDDAFEGEAVLVGGNVTVTYSDTDNPLESIRGMGLRVELEANEDLTFNNLWSEQEKTFRVVYKRDDVILFQGWLNPEGFFENWVNTNWIVSFDCVDGLGFLENLSFVEDETGFPITGRKTYLELLSLALLRTGLFLPINTAIDIRYDGLSESLDVLNNVYANTDRYKKDDDETIMSCEEVIRDVLEPLGAVLTSLGGEWYIYKPNQLYLNSEVTFYNYTYLGVPSITPTKTVDLSLNIGSNWKGAEIHHIGENQSISNKSSIGAYRVNYKYGFAKDLIENKKLYSSDGITTNNWSYLNSNAKPLGVGLNGVVLDAVYSLPSEANRRWVKSSSVDILSGISLNYSVTYTPSKVFSFAGWASYIQLEGVSGSTWYGTGGATSIIWVENNPLFVINTLSGKNGDVSLNFNVDETPEDGVLTVYIGYFNSDGETGTVTIKEFSLINPTETPTDLKGEFHTVQREDKPSSKIEDIKEVATGDNLAGLYEGTLYKSDSDTPTELWNRKGFIDDKPLLQIMCEETLRMSSLPARVFTGDIYGYYNYLSVIEIDGLSGLFMPISYSYDTKKNIISSVFRQIYGDELTDIDYTKTFDYGNTVKPTIKG